MGALYSRMSFKDREDLLSCKDLRSFGELESIAFTTTEVNPNFIRFTVVKVT